MRQVYSGAGVNTTSNVLSYLAGTTKPILRNLYIIGQPDSPYALFLTDHEGPLSYGLYPQQIFQPAVITRGDIPCKVGLDADSVSIDYSPGAATYANLIGQANPRTLAQQGFYDNWPVLNLWCFMPTPGDCNTLGCAIGWAGIIADTTVDRLKITWNTNSLMVLLDQQVPTNVIEATNSLANYQAAQPPSGFSTVPQFNTIISSNDTIIVGDVLPPYSSHHIFTTNIFQGGWLIFLPETGSTLDGLWSPIAANGSVLIGGINYNTFTVYAPFPWSPTPVSGGSGDQFIVSAPVSTTGGYGFLYVPSPEQAI